MTSPIQWDVEEREKRLQRLFEETHTTIWDGEGVLEIESKKDELVYQYIPTCHNITGMDSEMVAAMDNVIERYDLVVDSSSRDRTLMVQFISNIRQLFSQEPQPTDSAWITACHGPSDSIENIYTVFIAICKTVYGFDLTDITRATIVLYEKPHNISWTDL